MVCLPRALFCLILRFHLFKKKTAPFYINNEAINAIVLGCHLPAQVAIIIVVRSGHGGGWTAAGGQHYIVVLVPVQKRARNSKALQPKERTAIFITMFSQIAAPPPRHATATNQLRARQRCWSSSSSVPLTGIVTTPREQGSRCAAGMLPAGVGRTKSSENGR